MKELPKKYDPKEAEKRWSLYWGKENVYTFDPKSKKQFYSIDTPPPTVSGKMHMGHAFSFTQTDFIARYKRMAGFEVFYPFGTDDNGLPTQLLIEKLKKVRAVKMGRQDFTKLCIETLEKELRPKYVEDWKRIAVSCDWDILYSTIDDNSRKISQWSFIDLYKKKLAYRKYAPAMVCPKCRTSIAQVELEDHKRESTLNYVKAEVEGGDSITFATTRPELMMACIAITVHPGDERYKKLVGKKATIPATDLQVPILADDMSKMEFGTGAVYWCPYGDSADMEFVAKHPELDVRHIMNQDGKLNALAGKYEGMKSEEARAAVLADWKEAGALVKQEKNEQVVNVHERCGTPIEFVAMNQWAVKVLDFKEEWLELGSSFTWHPSHMKNRYDNWAKGLKWDWNISRQIFFGVPFPVWYCGKCDEPIMAKEEQLPVDPTTDKAPVDACPKCKHTTFVGENDIINTWATSSLTPQLAISLVGDEKVEKKLYPMDLRPQGHDIISFWLFNTVVKQHHHYDSKPWKDVAISGWALDPHGKKMSKSKGNVIEPQVMIEKYSADALRFWSSGSKLGDDVPFQEKDLLTGQKTVNKIWNASKFSLMHLADHKEGKQTLKGFDTWILTKLHKTIKESTESFDGYHYSKARAATDKFFWQQFCENYLEIVKDRLYNPDVRGEAAKAEAQVALYKSVSGFLKMYAPFMPYITEEVFSHYFAEKEGVKSIHNAAWPKFNASFIDESAEEIGDKLIDIIAQVRKVKSEKGVSLKEGVKELVLDLKEEDVQDFIDDLKAVTKAENVSFGKKVTISL